MSARPLTERQDEVLRFLSRGMVLRRQTGQRSFHLAHEGGGSPSYGPILNSAEVLRLQARFLAPFDPTTGERMPEQPSVYSNVKVEFRLRDGSYPVPA